MGGRIECYLDIASLYSYLAFLELRKNRELLASHNVEVDFHPVLIAGINAGSGNRPPWTLPAKAAYGVFDARRSIARHPGLRVQFPDDLMTRGKTMLPLRCLHYIKQTRPRAAFEAALHHLMRAFWAPPNTDLTVAANVARALRGVRKAAADDDDDDDDDDNDTSSPLLLFSADEVDEIMRAAGTDEIKAALKRATQEALDRGAFGAPWLWVTDGEGRAEPFFGSDRFHFVYRFLGLPYRDVTLLPPPSGGGEKSKL